MRTILLLLAIFFCGCTPPASPPVTITPEIKFAAELAKTLDASHAVEMAALNEQAEILQRIESAVVNLAPQKTPPGDSETPPAVADSSTVPVQSSPAEQDGVEVLIADCCDDPQPVKSVDDRPTLCITYADFNCPPCDRLKADIKAGKLSGFLISYDPAGLGLDDNRPAIRFERESSATGYAVIYGYNASILAWLKGELLPKAMTSTAARDSVITINPVVTQLRVIKPVASQTDLVSIHNQFHGGGSWTWPGDLVTHLRQAHGYNAGPSTASASCPGGNCPAPRTTYRRRR